MKHLGTFTANGWIERPDGALVPPDPANADYAAIMAQVKKRKGSIKKYVKPKATKGK